MLKHFCKSLSIFFAICILSLAFPVISSAANNYPNIFVHGLTGFAYGELGSDVHYWGGVTQDIIGELNSRNYSSMEAVVSPFSSNWDRTCELYAYIKGGRVDYGEAHSKKFGHERYGRTYPGIYPQWDGVSKIHLVGHSQGGTTSRLLDTLMRDGSLEEQNYVKENGGELSDLFLGGKEWIGSITTIGSPHNGTQVGNLANLFVNPFLYGAAAVANSQTFNLSYDFKLDQWGLKQNPGESKAAYMRRVLNSKVWTANQDIVLHEFTPEASATLNSQTNLSDDVYYFSYAGSATKKGLFSNNYYPISTMCAVYTFMGSYIGRTGPLSMRDNDSLVPVASARYPSNQPFKEVDNTLDKGIWNVYPTIQGWEHMDFVGQDYVQAPKIKRRVLNFYIDIVDRNINL